MYRSKGIILKLLILLIFTFCISAIQDTNEALTVYAAEEAPALKEQKITLYLGYKNYTVAIINLAKGAQVTYKSGNAKVAKVTGNGVIKAVAPGSATVTATVKQNKKTYNLKLKVTVKKPYLALSQSATYLNVGETAQFKAKAYGTEEKISWSSSDPEVAEVSSAGKVTAKKNGKATIYAKAGKLTAKCQLEIGSNRLGTFSREISLYNDFTTWIKVTDIMEGENLQLETQSSDIISCEWGNAFEGDKIALKLKPLKVGTDTITISSNKTNDKLIINVAVVEKPKKRKALTAEEIYELCWRSTVEIIAYYGDEQAIGSGFYADKNMIVTNYHVIEGAEKIIVKSYDGKTAEIKNIIGFDKNLDLAILGTDIESTPLAISQEQAKAGQDVYAIGSPYGLTGTMTKGMITNASRKMDNVDYIQIDASISEGNSGGPLVNKYGEVIGVITMYIGGGQNLNFAININELQKISTNRSMTIKEYNELYEQMFLEDMIANAIMEDPQKSQHMNSCQEIPSYTAVVGCLKENEDWDLYKIEMDYYGYFYAFIYYRESSGIDDTHFVLMDEYDEFYFAEKSDDSSNIAKLYEVLLSPGTYYIAILHKNENYQGEDIDYLFYTAITFG